MVQYRKFSQRNPAMYTESIKRILSKHGLKFHLKKVTATKTTKFNPINISGKQGEDLVENDIIRSGLAFSRQPIINVPNHFFEEKNKRFDFVINHKNEKIYVESKYQKVAGSVKDKIAGFIWSLTFIHEKVVLVLNGDVFKDKYVSAMVNRIQSDENLSKRIHIIKGSDFYSYLTSL